MSKTIVLTGATSGIGLALCLKLIEEGHTVFATGRSKDKLSELKEKTNEKLIPILMDLTSFKSIDEGLKEITKKTDHIDVLINNAAATSAKEIITEDGFEMQIQVNHLAVVKITDGLFPLIKKASGMVITTSSDAHRQTSFKVKALHNQTKYKIFKRYQETKLYNLIFTYYLDRTLNQSGVAFYAVHPGLVKTDLGSKNASWFVDKIWKLFASAGQAPEGPIPTYLKLINERPTPYIYYAYEKPNHHLAIVEEKSIQDQLIEHAKKCLNLVHIGVNHDS
jgi:NAD(P)-dependent dehydrogenase (short-subunit alcohol dehydrogenase family)